jgi:hypothetical protein
MKTCGEPEHTGLISRLRKPVSVPEASGTEGVPDSQEEEYQGAVFLEKIIKGRSIQTLVCIVMTLFLACSINYFVNCGTVH